MKRIEIPAVARLYGIPLLVLALSLTGCATAPRDMTLFMQGQDALDSGDATKAEELLNQALEANPDNPYALTSLGDLYVKQGRYDRAKPLCEKVVAQESAPRQATGDAPEPQEIARLARQARENLELIAREESVDEELLALEPAPRSGSALRDLPPTAQPLVREATAPVVVLQSTSTLPAAPRYRVQVGAFRSPASAQRLGERLSQRYADLMHEKEVVLTEVNGLTRVQVGPYQNLSEASDACRSFSRGGLRCFPRPK